MAATTSPRNHLWSYARSHLRAGIGILLCAGLGAGSVAETVALILRLPSVWREPPRAFGILRIHSACEPVSGRPEVLLVNPALLIHNEGHHARITVFRRPRDHCEPADHISVDYIIVLAARRMLPLAGKYLEVVAMERLGARVGFGFL